VIAARKATHEALLFTATGAGAVVSEAVLMASLMQGTLSTVQLIAGHTAVCAWLIFWAVAVRRRRGDWRLPVIMAMTTLVMGVVGAAGSLLGLFLHARYRRTALPFGKWYFSIFPGNDSYAAEEMHQSLRAPDESISIAPFIDILRNGETNQRLAVVALLARHFRPEFAPALKLALQDRNSAVRVQAATSSVQIENRFSEQAGRLTVTVRRLPNDVDAQLKLGRHYEEYADAGILDDERQRENFQTALDTYLRAAEMRPGDGAIMAAVGRLFLKRGRYADAEPWLRDAMATATGDPRTPLFYMETLFRLGRWSDLRMLSQRHADSVSGNPDLPAEAVEAVALWASIKPPEADRRVHS
jgi:tetratricopeptide (TPR) repeat protein